MGDKIITELATIATAIVGVAIVAVLVSQKANTSNIIASAGNALAADLKQAVSPVVGASF
jgi:hypothetical protein